ncbi:MAG: hypothetical protein QOI55_331 [Actinomycetota bacterium]|nr:hypothetical protein [Actinomycetota bacterium]
MLQGTFDTLSLTEVLGLLAQSHKTGALWLKAGSVEGRVYLDGGRCCAAESGDLAEPVHTDGDLGARLVDVCFTLARQPGGSFRFLADDEPPWRVGGGVVVDEAVEALDRLLEEWREIQAVIPSLEVRPRLAAQLGTDSIIVDQPRWRLLVCLDGNRSVLDVMQHTQRSVLDVCNALKELIEEGAVEIALEPSSAPAEAPPEVAEPEASEPEATQLEVPPAREPIEPVEPVEPVEIVEERAAVLLARAEVVPATAMPDPFASPEHDDDQEDETPENFATPEDAAPVSESSFEDGDGRDRGALLRLFSALRET